MHKAILIVAIVVAGYWLLTPTSYEKGGKQNVASSQTSSNSLVNGDFESGVTGWQDVTAPDISVVPSLPHTGVSSLQINGSTGGVRAAYQDVSATPGQTYNVEYWVNTNALNPGTSVRLYWLNVSNAPSVLPAGSLVRGDTLPTISGTTGWTKVTASFTAPAGSVVGRLILRTPKLLSSGGQAWFDNVSISVSTTTPPPPPPATSTLPTVSITSPTGGIISGTAYNITATASDDTGIASVQFKIDGKNIGSADTVAPYSKTLNTTLYTNGSTHTLTAVARDISSNLTTSAPVSVTIHNSLVTNITYCKGGSTNLKMDVHYPAHGTPGPMPLVIFIHGGAWSSGTKSGVNGWPAKGELISRGYVVASVDYRLAPTYKFPTFVHDVKCSVRHLRSKASFYNIDPNRIGVWGHSAGGHLAAMVATTDLNDNLEGTGGHAGTSSRVRAAVIYAGPEDLTILSDFGPSGVTGITNAFAVSDRAAGSPINYVTLDDPPMRLIHGDNDGTVFYNQAQLMFNKLAATSVVSDLIKVVGGAHSLVLLTQTPSPADVGRLTADFFDSNM